jgi:GxxExxY protein
MQPGFPIQDPETHAVIGAALEVHYVLGCGFLEHVYQDALALEFGERAISFEKEVQLSVGFKGRLLRATYRVDFICFGSLLVEVKALSRTSPVEHAQMLNYLKASRMKRGLMLNFGTLNLEVKRFVWTEKHHSCAVSDLG